MIIEPNGVRVGTGDLGDLLDPERVGDFRYSSDFMEEAAYIARMTLDENLGKVRELLERSNTRFLPTMGLLQRLETLHSLNAAPPRELGQMLRILNPGHGVEVLPKAASAVFSLDHIPFFISYYEQRVKEINKEMTNVDAALEETDVANPKYGLLQARSNVLEADLEDIKDYLKRLNDYEEYEFPVDVPDED